MKIDFNKPYGRTFGDDAATMPYIQDGLYFDSKGDLVDCQYNKDKLASRPPSLAQLETAPTSEPNDPRRSILEGKPPLEVFAMAEKLRAKLIEVHDNVEFAPDPENKAANIDFILSNTSE